MYQLASNWNKNRQFMKGNGLLGDCPIWGKYQRNQCWARADLSSDIHHYWSPRAGGGFSLRGNIADCMDGILTNDQSRKFFSRWVYEQNRNGIRPEILSDNVQSIVSMEELSIQEKMNNLLVSHAEVCEHPSTGIFNNGAFYEGAFDGVLLTHAYTDTLNAREHDWLKDAAVENGDLKVSKGHIHITPKGLQKIEENTNSLQSTQAFVAMWFDKTIDSAFDNAIDVAVKACGYNSYRVDRDRTHSDQITNKILAEIKNSKFLIADFTHDEKGARGGVYFEAGYAMGLGIPVIWAIRQDDTSKMHFDTNHYPHIVWENEEHLREELEAAILAHQRIGRGSL